MPKMSVALTARQLRNQSAEAPLIERTFGWMKAVAGLRKVKLRGLDQCRLAICIDGSGIQSLADSEAATVSSVAATLSAFRPALSV
jgi:hypothetical protein